MKEKKTANPIPNNTELWQAGFKTIDKALNNVIEKMMLLYPHRSLDQIAQMCSKQTDMLIKSEEQRNGYQFVGGEFSVSYVNEAAFTLGVELYFKDTAGKWIKVESKSQPRDMQYLMEDSIVELRQKKVVKFDIDSPEA